jgi:hypothetical protein
MNLAENNIYMRPPYEELPQHVASLVDEVRKDRDSPGPSLDQIRQDPNLAAFQWMGAGEPQVEEYFRTNIFPYPNITESLQRSDRQPMARQSVPNTGSKLKVSNPVPDMLYGYTRSGAFPQHQAQLISMGTDMVANNQGLLYPFFVIEFKGDGPSGGGTMWVATNQCLGGSTSCVNIAERLNCQLRKCKNNEVRPVNSAAFSIAMSGTEARLHVSWKHNELEYYMANVDSFLLQKPKDYLEFRKYVRNIIDWGKDKRLKEIRNSLDILLEESRRRTSEAAKSRQPPSDGSATASGKKRRSSSSRQNSSRSSSIKGHSRGANETYWALDETASQEIYEEPSCYPDQQSSFVDTDDYTASQDINEESALPAYLCLDDDQQDESQPVVSLGSSVEAHASFTTSAHSSFTSSFNIHGPDAHSNRPTASRSSRGSRGSKKHASGKD